MKILRRTKILTINEIGVKPAKKLEFLLNFTYIISKTEVSKCHSIPLVPMGAGTDKKKSLFKMEV